MWLKGNGKSCCLVGPLPIELGSRQQSGSVYREVLAGPFSQWEQRTDMMLSFSFSPCRLGLLCC